VNILCVAYRLEPVDFDKSVSFVPTPKPAANLVDETKKVADVEKKRNALLSDMALGGPYVSRIKEVHVATCIAGKVSSTHVPQPVKDGLDPAGAWNGSPASYLRELIVEGGGPGVLRVVAFDVKRLMKTLAAELAVAGNPLSPNYWYGPGTPTIDIEAAVLSSDFGWLSWPMVYEALGLKNKPLPGQASLKEEAEILAELSLRLGFARG
jgi:hypothetical protein